MDPDRTIKCKAVRALCLFLAFLQAIHLSAMQGGTTSSPQPNSASQKVMDQVNKVALGGKLTVRMLDGTEYHGHLLAITAADFTFSEVDLKRTLTLPYSLVALVKKNYGRQGFNGKRVDPKKSMIVAAVVLGTLFTVLLVALSKDKS